jgi:hypothetical protein
MTASNMRVCSVAIACQDFCHIGRDILTLARFFAFFHTRSPFHSQNRGGGRWFNFRMRFSAPYVRMNGASFAPNRMFIRWTVWPQLTIRMNEWQRFNIAPIKQRADRPHLLFHGAQSTMNSAVGSIREISPGRRETSYSGGWALRSGLWR